MIIGVPKEIKEVEKRVGMTPRVWMLWWRTVIVCLLKEVQGRAVVSPTRSIGKLEQHSLKGQRMSGREPTWW